MSRLSHGVIAVVMMFLTIMLLAGCANGPVSSGIADGGGYRIKLVSNAEIVPPGGMTTVTAYVRDSDDNPVSDGEIVVFLSEIGGTFDNGEPPSDPDRYPWSGSWAKTVKGIAQVVYHAPKEADKPEAMNRADRITASYSGANSQIDIQMGF